MKYRRNGKHFVAYALLAMPPQFELWMISIAALNEKDRKRREKEIAQNSLETFILDTQDKLSQEEFESVTTEEERTNILENCSQVFFYYYY